MGQNGPIRPCTKCDCNNNVDANAIGNCNRTTGECLRCIDNTDGFNCERCKSGFFGDALALKQPGDPPSCQPCQCYPIGTNLDEETTLPICNGYTGDCLCKPHVIGRNCEKCADGYFNLESGEARQNFTFSLLKPPKDNRVLSPFRAANRVTATPSDHSTPLATYRLGNVGCSGYKSKLVCNFIWVIN